VGNIPHCFAMRVRKYVTHVLRNVKNMKQCIASIALRSAVHVLRNVEGWQLKLCSFSISVGWTLKYFQKNKSVMKKAQKALEEFKEFAERRLINHEEELATTYQNVKVDENDLRHADHSHQQILEMELVDKIDELLTHETAHLGPFLSDVKDYYIKKLKHKVTP
jgi:hypothetical protein